MGNGRDLGRGRGCSDPAGAELSAVCVCLYPKADFLALAPSTPPNPIPRPPPPPAPGSLPPSTGLAWEPASAAKAPQPWNGRGGVRGRLPGPHLGAPGGGRRGGGFRSPPQLGSPPGHPRLPGPRDLVPGGGKRGSPPGRSPALPPDSESSSLQRLPPRPRQNPQERRALPATLGLSSPLPAGRSREVWGPAPGSAPGGGHAPHLTPLSPGLPAQEASPFFRPAPAPGERGDTTPCRPPPALQGTGTEAGGAGGRGLSRRAWPRADSPACRWSRWAQGRRVPRRGSPSAAGNPSVAWRPPSGPT